jgi:hypothetical protein
VADIERAGWDALRKRIQRAGGGYAAFEVIGGRLSIVADIEVTGMLEVDQDEALVLVREWVAKVRHVAKPIHTSREWRLSQAEKLIAAKDNEADITSDIPPAVPSAGGGSGGGPSPDSSDTTSEPVWSTVREFRRVGMDALCGGLRHAGLEFRIADQGKTGHGVVEWEWPEGVDIEKLCDSILEGSRVIAEPPDPGNAIIG